MTKKKSVWLLFDSRHFGGIETHILQLANCLHKHKIPIEVVFIADYGIHPLMALFERDNISFRVLSHGLYSLIYALRKERPLIVHTHGYKAGIYARIAYFFSKCTLVSTFHAGEHVTGKLALYDWVDRISAHLSHALIAVSAPINTRLSHQATIIDNFVALPETISNGKQIAFVGRLSIEKGPDILLKIATNFTQQSFHFYGDGPMQQALVASAGDNIVFHGHQQCMDKQWPNIGLLLMPSRHEGLPMAALEAMSRGIPVCAFDVGALSRLIEKKGGWLAPSGEIDTLSDGISQWLKSTPTQHALTAHNVRKKISLHFSDSSAIPHIIACYNRALRNNHCAQPHLREGTHDTY